MVDVSEGSHDPGVSESVWSMFLCAFVAIVLIPLRSVSATDGEFLSKEYITALYGAI